MIVQGAIISLYILIIIISIIFFIFICKKEQKNKKIAIKSANKELNPKVPEIESKHKSKAKPTKRSKPKIRKNKYTKTRNRKSYKYSKKYSNFYQNSASTKSNYKIQNDGATADRIIFDLDQFLKSYNVRNYIFSLSGIAGYPRHTDGKHLKIENGKILKRYKIGIEFHPSNFQISKVLKYSGKYPNKSWHESFIKPISEHLYAIFKPVISKYAPYFTIHASAIKSNGNIRPWIDIWVEINHFDLLRHLALDDHKTIKNFIDDAMPIFKKILDKEKVSLDDLYRDIDIRDFVLDNVEGILREKLGITSKMRKSVSLGQAMLYELLQEHFPSARWEYSPTWLGNQRFDIYIPKHRVAIEYNGRQHYNPVEYFGGDDGFNYLVKLDEKKRKLANENNVYVIDFPYWRSVTKKRIEKLAEKIKTF